MGIAAQTRDDWTFWPEREDVTLRSAAGTGYVDYALAAAGGAAKRRALTYREIAGSGGAYTSRDRVWLVPAANLPAGVTPKPEDRVRGADAVEWTVAEATAGKWGNTWKLVCRQLAVTLPLPAEVDLAAEAAGSAAAPAAAVKCWAAVAATVRALPEIVAGVGDRVYLQSDPAATPNFAQPYVLVSPARLPETIIERAAEFDCVGYPVRVAIFEPRGRPAQAATAAYAEWRAAIERAFTGRPLAGVPECTSCRVEPLAVGDGEAAAFDRCTGGLVVRAACWVPRGS